MLEELAYERKQGRYVKLPPDVKARFYNTNVYHCFNTKLTCHHDYTFPLKQHCTAVWVWLSDRQTVKNVF